MRIKFLTLFLLLFSSVSLQVSALRRGQDTLQQSVILGRYLQKLNALYNKCMQVDTDSGFPSSHSPYYYKALSPALLYRSALSQSFGITYPLPDTLGQVKPDLTLMDTADSALVLNRNINDLLVRMYARYPRLISNTEDQIHKVGVIQEDMSVRMDHEAVLVDQADFPSFVPDIGDSVIVVAKKPNFWKFYSNSSLQLYQYYNTKNWYKDRTDNYYNMQAVLKMGVSYNNKSKLSWENNLEMRLGFRPYPKDTEHQFKTSDDLVRLNSKIGYKATEHWNYTFFVEGTTQMLRSYYDNSRQVRSDFMSPFSSVVSLGMEYNMTWKKFTCSANMSPIAYNFKSVARKELATEHGIQEHHSTYNKFGPFVNVKYTWQIIDNIKLEGRIYWFSDLTMNTIEWENTFTFNVTKYILATLYLYPRFDDSSVSYKSKNGSYFMFKQYLSLGVSYNI